MSKPGPKINPDVGPLERTNLNLDAMTRRKLRVLGDGNESAGAREAARVAFDVYQGVRPMLPIKLPITTGRTIAPSGAQTPPGAAAIPAGVPRPPGR